MLKQLIDEIQKNVLLIPGPILEGLKKKYEMTRAIMRNTLHLEDERILILELEFWWQTLKTEKETIQNNNKLIERIENAFTKERWYVFEKVDEPYNPGLKRFENLHLQKLVLKKRHLVVISKDALEAEK